MQAIGKHGGNGGKIVSQMRRSKQAKQVGPNRIKSDIAQIQQARKPHHNIQAQGQHDVEQRQIDNTHPGIAGKLQTQRKNHQGNACGHKCQNLALSG